MASRISTLRSSEALQSISYIGNGFSDPNANPTRKVREIQGPITCFSKFAIALLQAGAEKFFSQLLQ